MKSDTWIGKKGLRFWYYHFRDSEYYGISIIGFTFLCSIILLFYVIVPEVSQWFSVRNEVIATRNQIATLQQNINYINSVNKNKLDSQLHTVSHALPPKQNFGFIINALSNAAATSGILLDDYAFQVGNITSGQGFKEKGTGQNGLSFIELTVVVTGNVSQVQHFIKSVEANLPLAKVTNINGAGKSVSVRIQFYQKPFATGTFSPDTPIVGLSPNKEQLIQKLSHWDHITADQNPPAQSGSNSAIPLF